MLCFYYFCLDQTAQPIPGIFLFKFHMKRLPEEIQDAFENENFVAQLSDSLFNKVCRLTIHKMLQIIKAHKDRGGIIGLT